MILAGLIAGAQSAQPQRWRNCPPPNFWRPTPALLAETGQTPGGAFCLRRTAVLPSRFWRWRRR